MAVHCQFDSGRWSWLWWIYSDLYPSAINRIIKLNKKYGEQISRNFFYSQEFQWNYSNVRRQFYDNMGCRVTLPGQCITTGRRRGAKKTHQWYHFYADAMHLAQGFWFLLWAHHSLRRSVGQIPKRATGSCTPMRPYRSTYFFLYCIVIDIWGPWGTFLQY